MPVNLFCHWQKKKYEILIFSFVPIKTVWKQNYKEIIPVQLLKAYGVDFSWAINSFTELRSSQWIQYQSV